MRIGITGHQARDGIDWSWVKTAIRTELSKIVGVELCLSALATGSDQVFAEAALGLRIPVLAVIPMQGYEGCFQHDNLAKYRQLLGRCKVLQLNWHGDKERSFFEAGKHIVAGSDMMFAVWDGKRARGQGGTGDVVELVQNSGKLTLHINPIEQSIHRI
jgi:hypothetical protein